MRKPGGAGRGGSLDQNAVLGDVFSTWLPVQSGSKPWNTWTSMFTDLQPGPHDQ